MSESILITGGAGFIGSHLADELLAAGHRVRVLDNLAPQVHGADAALTGTRPDYLSPEIELVVGDVRDRDIVDRALAGVTAVYHFAAAVGVGQSMYEIANYTSINNLGTGVLLEALAEHRRGSDSFRRLVVASSMSIYGEGLYRDSAGEITTAVERTLDDLKQGRYEARDALGQELTPAATPETKQPSLASVYALSKYDQERMCLMIGRAYDIPTVALRFFNAYGTRQALSNPYTGVLAIFASRLLNDRPPLVFEDGYQQRDFVHVTDIARGCRLALEQDEAIGEVINIGSGEPRTVREIAAALARTIGREDLQPEITNRYRIGDIRHCFADISRARNLLGYEPRVTLDAGLTELAQWLSLQTATDRVADASRELAARGLTV